MGAGAIAIGALAGLQLYGSYTAGRQERSLLKQENAQLEMQQRAESVRAMQQQTAIQSQLNKDIASARAIFGARGVGAGTARAIELGSTAAAGRDIEKIRAGEALNRQQTEMQQAVLTQRGRNIKQRSFFEGVGGAGQTVTSYAAYTRRS